MTYNSGTVVIPTTLKNSIIYKTLLELSKGLLTPMAVVIVVDTVSNPDARIDLLEQWISEKNLSMYHYVVESGEFGGAGSARNVGIKFATDNLAQDFFLFLGDDCVPDFHMFGAHVCEQTLHAGELLITQGYSPYPKSVLTTPFMNYIARSNITANWGSLIDETGTVVDSNHSGFFLTTNVAVSAPAVAALCVNGELFPCYPGAAWEDVTVGARARALGIKTTFLPNSVVWHTHHHDPVSFANRQLNEGGNRLLFCVDNPTSAPSMLPDADTLPVFEETDLPMVVSVLQDYNLHKIPEAIPDVMWQQVLQTISVYGTWREINSVLENNSASLLQAWLHIKNNTTKVLLFSAIKAQSEGDKEYIEHCAHWVYQYEGDTFGGNLFSALAYITLGKWLDAREPLLKCIKLDETNELPVLLLRRVTELLERK